MSNTQGRGFLKVAESASLSNTQGRGLLKVAESASLRISQACGFHKLADFTSLRNPQGRGFLKVAHSLALLAFYVWVSLRAILAGTTSPLSSLASVVSRAPSVISSGKNSGEVTTASRPVSPTMRNLGVDCGPVAFAMVLFKSWTRRYSNEFCSLHYANI